METVDSNRDATKNLTAGARQLVLSAVLYAPAVRFCIRWLDMLLRIEPPAVCDLCPHVGHDLGGVRSGGVFGELDGSINLRGGTLFHRGQLGFTDGILAG